MSTQHGGGARKPSATKATAGGKPSDPAADAGKPTARKSSTGSTAAKAGGRPAAKTGGKGGGPRKPISPVKVSQGRNWGPIALFTVVGLLAVAIIGYGSWAVYDNGMSWSERAARIDGLENWRKKDPTGMKSGDHKVGPVDYSKMAMSPPVGGPHNQNWQRCQGDVYDAPIATEHAIHSMEHGAVWITYKPDLAQDQVEQLAKRVRGNDYTLMSPFEKQEAPISVQTWGYQLKVDNANDARIDEFLKALRQRSSIEGSGATCTSGAMITETGTTPRDLAPPQQQDPAGGAGQPGDPAGGGGQPAG